MNKTFCFIILSSLCCITAFAVDLTRATIVWQTKDAPLVGQMAQLLADDIQRVSGIRPALEQTPDLEPSTLRVKNSRENIVFLSTVKHTSIHKELRGTWERFVIDSHGNNIYITGSDPRGLAYGVLHVYEAIGVNPWYWFADVPVDNSNTRVRDYRVNFVSRSPSVKYRGFFINDEDWGLKTWAAENYGYMKRERNDSERRRSGGSGVYYHLSYLGTPHDNLWIATTAPALMYEELQKAYSAGADRYWLLNVGDIKPMEIEMQQFFDMAYDFDAFNFENANRYQAEWLAKTFNTHLQPQSSKKDIFRDEAFEDITNEETEDLTARFQFVLDNFYRLAWDRKPEFMGYEIEWDSRENSRLHDSDFSFVTGTAQKRLVDYQNICFAYDAIERAVAPELRPALFEMLGYAVHSACQMNRKFLFAQANHETGEKIYAEMSRDANREIERLRERYNSMLNGKWRQMISQVPPGFCALYQQMPEFTDKPTDAYRLPESQLHPEMPKKINLSLLSPFSPFRLIEGLGTDWIALQLGMHNRDYGESAGLSASIDIPIPEVEANADSIKLCISVLPLWPATRDVSNRFGVSADGGEQHICENRFAEWSWEWKLQVLENRKEFVLTFPLNKSRTEHTLSLSIIDPGQIVQKITYSTFAGIRLPCRYKELEEYKRR